MLAISRTQHSMKQAEARAQELSWMFALPPIPVHEIAENSGFNVIFTDFGKNWEKVSGICHFDKARIYVNKHDLQERQRYAMAYELGHLLLHKEAYEEDPDDFPYLQRFHKADPDNPLAREADRFASCLLVPRMLLAPVTHGAAAELAKIFGVTRTLMELRLREV